MMSIQDDLRAIYATAVSSAFDHDQPDEATAKLILRAADELDKAATENARLREALAEAEAAADWWTKRGWELGSENELLRERIKKLEAE